MQEQLCERTACGSDAIVELTFIGNSILSKALSVAEIIGQNPGEEK
jgi:hypothetical protein